MCETCGCGESSTVIQPRTKGTGEAAHGPSHPHEHGHAHAHPHEHGEPPVRRLKIEQDLMGENNRFAAENRRLFQARHVFALNLISSPGAGKTTLLAETMRRLLPDRAVAAVIGDQQTTLDADRIADTGAPAVQINTGKGCHLDAHMIAHAIPQVPLVDRSLLFIENVGNLVCPAGFDLGETRRAVLLSVTEGEDKPLKYPEAFRSADLFVLTKLDLIAATGFDEAKCLTWLREVNPRIDVLRLSARTGEGMDDWFAWLEAHTRLA